MIHVVIADDEEKVCLLICSLIDWASLDMKIVGVAHDGIEALQLIKEKSPDLIVTDIRMPGCDGLQLIEKARELKEDLEFIIISGCRHFEYAQNAIKYGVSDYLLKPIKKEDFLYTLEKIRERNFIKTNRITQEQELITRRKKDINRIRSEIFTDWLLKQHDSKAMVTPEQINATYHFQFTSGYYQCLAIKIDCHNIAEHENGLSVLREKTCQIITNQLEEITQEIELYYEGNVIYCIVNFAMDLKKELRHRVKMILDQLLIQKTLYSQYDFTIGLGSVSETISDLKYSLKRADTAIHNRLIEGTGKIIECRKESDKPEQHKLIILDLDKKLKQALEILHKDNVLQIIGKMQQYVADKQDITGTEILFLIRHVYEMYLYYLLNLHFKERENLITKEEFYRQSEYYGSVTALFELLTETIEKSMDNVIKEQKQADSKPIRIAKEYIQQNYKQSLSLEDVGNHIGFNATYFSAMFKKECGINFLEYIMEVRMEKAKELLRETNLSISVICEEVGYIDIKHFTKSFKKNAGIKPTEYRKLYA